MWLSEKLTRGRQKEAAEYGTVTIGGENAAVLMSGEARNLETICPNGLSWLPEMRRQVVVVHTADGERLIVGMLGGSDGDLEGGEVRLYSQKASLTLKNNGDLLIKGESYIDGNVYINGRLFVNGALVTGG